MRPGPHTTIGGDDVPHGFHRRIRSFHSTPTLDEAALFVARRWAFPQWVGWVGRWPHGRRHWEKVDIWGTPLASRVTLKHADGIYAVIDLKGRSRHGVLGLDRPLSLNSRATQAQGEADRQALGSMKEGGEPVG